jgi:hypothetical protein
MNQFYMLKFAPFVTLSAFGVSNRTAINIFKASSHFAIMAPLTISAFLFSTAYIRSDFNKEAGVQNVRTNLYKTLCAAACFWPIVNFIAYHYLPFHLRYACFDFFSFIYAVGLSCINNNDDISDISSSIESIRGVSTTQ